MRITVVGLVVGGNLLCLPFVKRVKVKTATRMIYYGGLVTGPARVGKLNLFPLLIGKWLGVGNGACLGIKIGHIKCATRHLALKAFLVLETNLGFIDRYTDAIQKALLCQITLNPFETRLPIRIGTHQVIVSAQRGMSTINQYPSIG